jgi:uncharacterized membrane protein YfcA
MRALLASPLGVLIGMSLGALGGGGSILAAYAMWRRGDGPHQPATRSVGAAALPGAVRTGMHLDGSTVAKVLVAGTVVGLLTGLFGVGGGFVIVPALVLSLHFDMPDAVGTTSARAG